MREENAANLRCKNCGQPVLPTDSVCWQCGWKLAAPAVGGQTGDGERPLPITAVAVYAALTLLLILLLLLVFSLLASYPLALA